MNSLIKPKLFLIGLLSFSLYNSPLASCRYDLGDFHHHSDPKRVCLKHRPDLSEEQLDHFFKRHLESNIKFLDLENQKNLENRHLQMLADSPDAAGIIRLNLKWCKKITYEGIVALLKSPTFGSQREDEAPVYDRRYNKPISIIKVEIGHTRACDQFESCVKPSGKKIFPLPLVDDFNIKYLSSSWDSGDSKSYRLKLGLKKIIITDHGEILK